MGARFLIFGNHLNIHKVDYSEGTMEVHYSVFPFLFNRVAVYDTEEFIDWISLSHTGNEQTVSIDFFTEEFGSVINLLIEEFHFEQLPIQGRAENRRLERIIAALERRITSFINKKK